MSPRKQLATGTGDMLLLLYSVGDHVELAAHTDHWAAGDRFGQVVSIGCRYVHVALERSGRTVKVVPENIRTTP